MNNLEAFKAWLSEPCSPEEVSITNDGGAYMAIPMIREKIKYAELMFNASFRYKNFNHIPLGSVFISGSIELIIMVSSEETAVQDRYEVIVDELVGASTFRLQEYEPNQHYAAICKSLSIANALLKYPQFGALLNRENLVSTESAKGSVLRIRKVAGEIERKKLDLAFSSGDDKTIEELNNIYIF